MLVFDQLPTVGVEAAFGCIPIDLHRWVFVALAQNPTFALLNIRGPPGHIKMVECNQFGLHVGSGSHFLCTAHQDAHLSGTHFCKQSGFFGVGISVMDKCNLFLRNTFGNQLVTDIVVNVPFSSAGGGQIGEDQLRRLCGHGVLPNLKYLAGAGRGFVFGNIREKWVEQPLIESQFPAIRCNFEHVICVRVYIASTDFLGTLSKSLDAFFL